MRLDQTRRTVAHQQGLEHAVAPDRRKIIGVQ